MSHVLCLSFTYKWYKKNAVLRIFADDHLIDELSLTQSIPLKAVNYDNMPIGQTIAGLDPDAEFSNVIILPEKLFLFEIQESYLNQSIRIEVQNDNNNHNNGFMTQYSYINFHLICIVPKCLLTLDNWHFPNGMVSGSGPNYPTLPRPEDIIVKSCSKAWPLGFVKHARGGSFIVDMPLSRKHKIVHFGKLGSGRVFVNHTLPQILCAFKVLNTTA
jgi:hypothetical protein